MATKTIQKENFKNIEKFSSRAAVKVRATEKTSEVPVVKKNWKKITLFSVVLLIIIGSSVTAFYFYHKYKAVPAVETDDIVLRVGKLMELPKDENPVLATVSDREKVKEQPFFANAENGDKVLIYSKSQKAVLYRPSINKLIEVMNFTAPMPQAELNEKNVQPAETAEAPETAQTPADATEQTPSQAAATSSIKIAVYNGSGIKGKAATLAAEVLKIEGTEVMEKTNAIGSFEKTIVVDLSGKNGEMAQKIATSLSGEVGDLPEGETKPDADILVIGGEK